MSPRPNCPRGSAHDGVTQMHWLGYGYIAPGQISSGRVYVHARGKKTGARYSAKGKRRLGHGLPDWNRHNDNYRLLRHLFYITCDTRPYAE